MAFVVDGAEWRFDDETAEEIEDALFRLLDRIEAARKRNEVVWCGDDLFTQSVFRGVDMWSLFAEGAPLALGEELRQALAAAFTRVGRYCDETDWPPGFGERNVVSIDDEPAAENGDLAWAHHQICAGRAVACLGIRRSGRHRTTSPLAQTSTWWVTDERSHRDFFREAIDVERDTPATLERLAPHAFPDLHFVAGLWDGLGDFEGGYDHVRGELRRHLRVYDDWGAWAFEGVGNRQIEARFREKHVEVAPEKADVYRDQQKRQARERDVGGTTLYCEWHGKLEGHRNRIYFHAPVPVSGNRLIVAIFHRHL